MMELNQLEHEAQEAIDSLDAWMRPERVGTNVVNVPGASYVHSDPLGVVLVIGGVLRPERLSRAFDPENDGTSSRRSSARDSSS